MGSRTTGSGLQDRERSEAYNAPRAGTKKITVQSTVPLCTVDAPSARLWLSLSLQDFQLQEHLGDGSFSQVLRAQRIGTTENCALKIIDKHLVLRNKQWHQVRTERNCLDRLEHDGIVQLLFTFQDAHSLYLGLEYCPNGELFEQMTQKGRLSLSSTRAYAAEIVDILQYLHAEQVVHRDLKPENLLLSSLGHLKLADFGSAKDLSEAAPMAEGMRANILSGTADYIAPEVLRNEAVTCAADLWALGCLTFQMLVGRPPFRDSCEYLTLERVAARSFAFPASFPADARDLVDQLLVDEPCERLGARPKGFQELKQHVFFSGVDWEHLRDIDAPAWVPKKPHDEGAEFSWELTSLLSTLPLHVEPALDAPASQDAQLAMQSQIQLGPSRD